MLAWKEWILNLLDAVIDAKSRTIILDFATDKLNLSSVTEMSDSSQDIDIAYEKDQMKLAFDLKYLTEAIKQLKGDMVILELRSAISPVIIKEEGYVHVIMPKRI